MFQNAVPVCVCAELLRQRSEKWRIMVIQQIPQLALERNRRDLSAAVRPLPRIAFAVGVAIWIGIDNFNDKKPCCTSDFVIHALFPPHSHSDPVLLFPSVGTRPDSR